MTGKNKMENDLLSLKEAAEFLGISILGLVRDSKSNEVPSHVIDGTIYFSKEELLNENVEETVVGESLEEKVEQELIVPEPVIETPVIEEPVPEIELTPEKFTHDYIQNFIDERNRRGVHVKFDGYNRDFRKIFPGLDPVKETQRMEKEGLLRIFPTRGGVKIYLPALEKVVENVDQYNYHNKNEWREKWSNFQSRNLTINKRSKVLYLGGFGSEVEGYLNLGVPLENQVAVEEKSSRASFLREKFPGLKVEEEDILNYLATTKDKFDAIMLDFDGSITERKLRSVEIIVRRQLLKEKSVLGVNFFANREMEAAKMLYLQPYLDEKLESLLGNKGGFKDEIPPEVLDKNNLNGHRDYGITNLMLKLLMGKDSLSVNGAILNSLSRNVREKWKSVLEKMPPQDFMGYIRVNDKLRATLEKNLEMFEINPYLSLSMTVCHSQPYFVRAMKRISYQAKDKQNLFFSDFYALDQRKDICGKLVDEASLLHFLSGNQNCDWLNSAFRQMSTDKRKRLNRLIKLTGERINPEYIGFIIYDKSIPRRENIPPVSRRKNLTYDEAFRLFEKGYTTVEVREMFPNIKKMTIANYKSRHTHLINNKV